MAIKIKFKDETRIVKRKLQITKERVLRAGGPIGVKNMRSFVPVDTWSLSDSIRLTFDFEGNRLIWNAGGTNRNAAQLHDPVVYAQIVEFGRSDLPAYPIQPYFVPGLVDAVSEIKASAVTATRGVLGG